MTKPKVKICCISSIEEAQLAIQFGASALGLVGAMPSGPGIIDDSLIRQIAASVQPPVSTFLLTSETNAESILEHHRRVNTTTIQIVDALDQKDYRTLRNQLPDVTIVQVIHVLDDSSVDEAIEIAGSVDAILLDSGNPNLAVKELGGTGRTHNWKLSRKIVEAVNVPVFLAGGLNKNNVKEAVETVNPYGLDLCSGVRTDGKLDPIKLKDFFEALN